MDSLNGVFEQFNILERDMRFIDEWFEIFEIYRVQLKKLFEDILRKQSYDYFFNSVLNNNILIEENKKIYELIDYLRLQKYDYVCKHYKMFWNKEISTYGFEDKYELSNVKKEKCISILEKWKHNDFTNVNEDISFCDSVNDILLLNRNKISDCVKAIALMDKIKDIEENIVLIGANGSGKSTYSRALSEIMSENISLTVLASQHYLRYEMRGSWTDDDIWSDLHNWQKSSKRDLDETYSDDLPKLVSALVEQHIQDAMNYYEGIGEKVESDLDRVLKLWHEFFPNIILKIKKYRLLPIDENGNEYDFNELSDGERTVFYYIGHVLTSRENAYIVVDEPENHMNSGLSRKLWNRLEEMRSDCKFIYITHDLEFATTRLQAVMLWNKKYVSPTEWQIERINGVEELPQQLVMEILGSKERFILCEGKEKSYDKKLYTILFPDYQVSGVGGHSNVIKYVSVYNEQVRFNYEVYGIIDKDWHDTNWIQSVKKKKTWVLPINEVENILCDKRIIEKIVDEYKLDASLIDEYMKKFWDIFNKRMEEQAKEYMVFTINYMLKNLLVDSKLTLDDMSNKLCNAVGKESLEMIQYERIQQLQSIYKEQDYDKALSIVNFKQGLLNILAQQLGFSGSRYPDIALSFIRKEEELQTYLKTKYFDGFLR